MHRGTILRQLRRKLNLTQENIAFDVGISQKQVSRIENGTSHARVDVLDKWCAALGITLRKLEKLCNKWRRKNGRDNLNPGAMNGSDLR